MKIAGILLAGGRSIRMGGGDKCLRDLGGRTILARVIERAAPQVTALALNANGDPGRFAVYGLPVVADASADYAGPLAGILAGLDWAARAVPGATHVASFATDAPFLPTDLVARLAAALADGNHDIACADSGGRAHPVFGLWPLVLRNDLRQAMAEGIRKVDRWMARYRLAHVEFLPAAVDPFFNVNSPGELAVAVQLLAATDHPSR